MENILPLDLSLFVSKIHKALRSYHSVAEKPKNLLNDLILVQNEQRSSNNTLPSALRLATNKVLFNGIKDLEEQDSETYNILLLRFVEKYSVIAVSQTLNLSQDQVKRRQRKGIQELSELILSREREVRKLKITNFEDNLAPKTYSKLFGIEETKEKLRVQLLSSESPWVISLTGIGGIGKTSLANETVREVIKEFHYENIVWVNVDRKSANPMLSSDPAHLYDRIICEISSIIQPHISNNSPVKERSIAIRQMLKGIPCLIIIDNLEMTSDTSYLLSNLNDLANPSRFLLTSRNKYPQHSGISSFNLQELELEIAIEFIKHYSSELGLLSLASSSVKQLQNIYQLVGGNPLALKLVVSMAAVRSMTDILEDLISVRTKEIEQLYLHIFQQSWKILGNSAKILLSIMPLAADSGITSHQMASLSELSQDEIWPAIQELVSLSLLEVYGDAWERRYGIHQLLETFLRTNFID